MFFWNINLCIFKVLSARAISVFLFSVMFFLLLVWAGTDESSMLHPISLGLSNVYALERFRLRNAWIGHPFTIALLLLFSISFILESPRWFRDYDSPYHQHGSELTSELFSCWPHPCQLSPRVFGIQIKIFSCSSQKIMYIRWGVNLAWYQTIESESGNSLCLWWYWPGVLWWFSLWFFSCFYNPIEEK